ncbi:DUF2064 domain-containing protein [Lewinella sp. IMCC34191]|uniref:DUF2064 domain-containing protein n=1 Tax=Lewinella sp. IMCC34191 TaxID=2259172 RepID=UPI001300BBBA|nr:DUF2064 domain-containing protein [Lewinella sp. IMCC34191]
MSSTTAILFFSRSAQAEASEKFAGHGGVGDRIATALIGRTLRVLSGVRLPVYHFDESRQEGSTFGERLGGCLREVFDFGYESVIVVGNDAPRLTARHLHAAADRLLAGDVIGPNGRGGIYILGLHRTTFESTSIREACWQTESLYDELAGLLEGVQILPGLNDCNTVADIRQNWSRWKHLLPTLAGVLTDEVAAVDRGFRCAGCRFRRFTIGRAPPVAA